MVATSRERKQAPQLPNRPHSSQLTGRTLPACRTRADGTIIAGNNGADTAGEYRVLLSAESPVHLTSAGLIR